jgi:hypothetical protein
MAKFDGLAPHFVNGQTAESLGERRLQIRQCRKTLMQI